MPTQAPIRIRLGHSPDSDDAFMFWGLAKGQVQSEFEFEHILKDIQTLNVWALEGKLESTAISVHAFAYVADKYALLRHGGSFGEEYGPMVVASRALSMEELETTTIAIPGKLTSAFLELNLWWKEQFGENSTPQPPSSFSRDPNDVLPSTPRHEENEEGGFRFEVVPFDEIIPAVQSGRFDAGLIIHEGQLTYKEEGLHLVVDLGVWWNKLTGLPLPLGVNVVRKDLGPEVVKDISRCMRESIHAGLANRAQALDYALQFARGMDVSTSDEFVGMYVNERTLDMGDDGIKAIRLLLQKGADAGLVPAVAVEVVD